jgi:hypothetical protein
MNVSRAGVRSAVVGVLLSVGAFGTQTDAGQPSLIRRDVAPPSSDFTTYIEGELVRVSVPSNWRELPAFDAVTFAPEGAYGNAAGLRSVFTHGLGMGLARNDKRDLRVTRTTSSSRRSSSTGPHPAGPSATGR